MMAETNEELPPNDPDVEGFPDENIDNKETKIRGPYWKHFHMITVGGQKYAKCSICTDKDV
jgi:hypothetical protein